MYGYDLHPSVQYHLPYVPSSDDIGTIIVVTDPSLTSQGDLNNASELSSTHLPVALEDSTPTERDGQPGNIAAGAIVQGQETSLSARVPLIVTNGLSINHPGFLGNGIPPYTNEPGLDQQVSTDSFNYSWSSPSNILIPAHECSWICRTFHMEG
jgi:hypothetical protein